MQTEVVMSGFGGQGLMLIGKLLAKAGLEDGHALFGASIIVDPNGVIVAETQTEGDEVVVHPCDLDATAFGKQTIFDFARHRRTEHYGRITSQTGVVLPE